MFITPISQSPSLFKIQENAGNPASNTTTSNIPFAQVFQDAVQNLKQAQETSDQDAYNLSIGAVDDLHSVMINSEKMAAALELTVQLTNKALGAYNEIMRMQV